MGVLSFFVPPENFFFFSSLFRNVERASLFLLTRDRRVFPSSARIKISPFSFSFPDEENTYLLSFFLQSRGDLRSCISPPKEKAEEAVPLLLPSRFK